LIARPHLLAAALLLAIAGCMLPHRVGVTADGAPQYEQVRIVYTAHAAQGACFLPAAYSSADAEGERWAMPQLTIEYPHPDGDPALARATLRLLPVNAEAGPPRNRFIRLAAWRESLLPEHADDGSIVGVLDVPKHQLDLLIVDLARTGYFDPQTVPSAPARLAVQIDSGRLAKPWSFEPRLDDFVVRTQAAGL
jgi:hypothetical protein